MCPSRARAPAERPGRVAGRSHRKSRNANCYAHSLGVIFPAVDEDYGYVTLEAMLSSKPVITCADSGGPLEFVVDGSRQA